MRFTIRHKLLLLSIALLSIPIVGFQYLRETERYLQTALEASLQVLASAVSQTLQASPGVLRQANTSRPDEAGLFVHPLNHAVQVDG